MAFGVYGPENGRNYFLRLYSRMFWHYSTPRKIVNILHNLLEQKQLKTNLYSFPFIAQIDPSNICPLHCPLCPTGMRERGRKGGLMTFDVFKKITDELFPYLFFVRLSNRGEPFTNSDIFRMIKYFHQRRVGVVTSTNLMPLRDGDPEALVTSGLDWLIVAIDGVTQGVYEKYRVGGDLKKAFFFLERIIELKKKFKTNTPVVEWQYVLGKHNSTEREKAVQKARKTGVDLINFIDCVDMFSYSRMQLRDKEEYHDFVIDNTVGSPVGRTCSWLYSRAVINWDGTVQPCCSLDLKEGVFGDVKKESFKTIWQNENFQNARKLFVTNIFREEKVVCDHCLFVRQIYQNTKG